MKQMRLMRSVGLLLLAAILTGCPATKNDTDTPKDGNTIIIRGSNTFGEDLAPRLMAEFKKDHPSVVFDAEFKATPYGIGALLAGRCDIGAASRPLTTNEQQMAQSRSIEFNDYVIGSYAVAVIVNASNPVQNLTSDQVRDIFTGAIQNWKDVGGPDAPIHLYVRDPISGAYIGFQELSMEKKSYASDLKTFAKETDIVQAVSNDANGIGYASIELATKGSAKPVSIGGIAPTVASVDKGEYPYSRVLRFYTDKAKEARVAHEFVEFVQSPTGQQILEQLGFVPHP